MTKKILLTIITLSLFACNQQAEQKLPDSPAIAIVGDSVISADLLKAYLLANGIKKTDEATTKQAMENLISEVAVANIAYKNKLTLSPEQLNTIEYLKIRALADAAKQDHLAKNKITEEEINQEYQNGSKQSGNKEYHLHLLMYQDEVQAIKELEKLNTKEDYLALESVFKKQNPNIRGVGDIGWVKLPQLPKSFRSVLPQLKAETLYKSVLNSKYGAHIIYLEDIRDLVPPKLEDVRQGIIKTLEAKKVSKFTQLAKAKARVKIKE
jgi:peptidyl-prolyl cis-trans isomerase C